jgi:hypothetical protein
VKIFIGGIKPVQIRRLHETFPGQEFLCAGEFERASKWVRLAAKCQHFVVLQHRTSHTHTESLMNAGIKPLFTDSMPIMNQIIKELITNGKAGHSYVHAAGSKGAAATAGPTLAGRSE